MVGWGGVKEEPLWYVNGEHEPFTGVAFSNHSNGKRSMESSIINGKKSVQLKWDEDGNLIEKETF